MAKDYSAMTIEHLEKLLDDREKKFVEEYEECNNATLSAQNAGYSPDNSNAAAVTGHRLLRSAKISAYRRARAKELYGHIGITKETVATRINKVYLRSVQAVPHYSWNAVTKEWEPDGTWTFDSNGALKALKLMGESIGMFEQKISATVTTSVEEFLNSAGDTEY